jgi:hypothetical protein
MKEKAANNAVDLLGSTSARRKEEKRRMPIGGDSFDISPSASDPFVKCFLLEDPDIIISLDNGILSASS